MAREGRNIRFFNSINFNSHHDTKYFFGVTLDCDFSPMANTPFFTYKEFSEKPTDIVERLNKHINPLSFPELEYILSGNNMKLEEVTTNIYLHKKVSLKGLIAMLAYPFIKTLMVRHFGRRTFLSTNELICGHILVLKAE